MCFTIIISIILPNEYVDHNQFRIDVLIGENKTIRFNSHNNMIIAQFQHLNDTLYMLFIPKQVLQRHSFRRLDIPFHRLRCTWMCLLLLCLPSHPVPRVLPEDRREVLGIRGLLYGPIEISRYYYHYYWNTLVSRLFYRKLKALHNTIQG